VLCRTQRFLKIFTQFQALSVQMQISKLWTVLKSVDCIKTPDEPVLLFSCQSSIFLGCKISPFISGHLFLPFKITFLLYKEINL